MKITVITINYNNLKGLKKTMSSVLEQTYANIEYIVIDGGSNDGSKAYIESFHKEIYYWISEDDNGIYNAMNKGLDKATGEYVLFLNSGDWLEGVNIIESIQPSEFIEDIISCGIHIIGDNIDYVKQAPKEIRFSFLFNNSLPHPATFIKRNILLKLGGYDENLKIVSDWKFFILAICKHGATYKNIPIVLSNFNLFGRSSIKKNSDLLQNERQTILIEEFGPYYKDLEEITNLRGRLSALRKSGWIKILIKFRRINKF